MQSNFKATSLTGLTFILENIKKIGPDPMVIT